MRDPLTEAIFGESDEAEEGIFVREEEVDALTEAIFARLDSSAPAKPIPRLAKDELTRESILREIEGLSDAEAVALEAQFISRPLPKRRTPQQVVLARANDDWFQVHSAEKPLIPSFKVKRHNWSRIFPAILLGLLVLGGIFFVTRGDFFNFSSRKLEGASFSLLNAEQSQVFPPAARLAADLRKQSQNLIGRVKEEPGRKKEFLAIAEEAEAIQEVLDQFFEANQNFSWLNVFRSPPSYPQALDRFEEAINRAETLDLKTRELRNYLGWLRFWEKLFARDGRYLVIAGDSNWAVLEVLAGRASINSSGRLSELNAALTTKIIPPPAVQTAKTNFDFYEADWFLDSRAQSEIMARLFSATTQTSVDGVILVLDTEIAELIPTLESTADWRSLERTLRNAFDTHELALFFEEAELQSFVEKERLAQVLELGSVEDGLALSLHFWEGPASGWEIEGVEYSPEFFVDGSIVSKLKVRVKNLGSKTGSAYLKLYLPLASTLLESTGFGPRRSPPAFDYEGGGFSAQGGPASGWEALAELLAIPNDSTKFSQLDFFDEQGFLAVGGWVGLQPGRSGAVTLEYRLPFRLDWRRGSDIYKLKVLKPGEVKELPFVFVSPTSEEVGFEVLRPLSETALTEDATIQARVTFK